MDRLLDGERFGPAHLRTPAVARVVIAALHAGGVADYHLHAWVLMPNHAHFLITPRIDPSVAFRRLKGVSAREANKLLNLTGRPFWQRESYDHLVRDPDEFRRIENYILENPVRAGIARTAAEYPWSSGFGGLKPSAG